MDPFHPSPFRHLFALLLGVSAAVLSCSSAFSATAAASRSLSSSSPLGPPAFPDACHVPEGCYVSTLAYLARFQREFPCETGAPLTVVLRSFGGPHTIAVVSWRGRWWGRDEYSGVFDLRCAVAETRDIDQLRDAAEFDLGRLSSRLVRAGRIKTDSDSLEELSDVARRNAVMAAAQLLPCPGQIFWVRRGRDEVPFLYFQPTKGVIAVYDPANGTATAECTPTDIPGVVATVAARLGYTVAGVRPHVPSPSAERVASVQIILP